MKPIIVNELGSINISEDVIKKIVFSEMLKCKDTLIPCNKNGRPLTKSDINKSKDSFGSVDVSFDDDVITVEINYIALFGKSIKKSAKELFKNIIDIFSMIGIETHVIIYANVKGIMSDKVAAREIRITWNNNRVEVL